MRDVRSNALAVLFTTHNYSTGVANIFMACAYEVIAEKINKTLFYKKCIHACYSPEH